MNSDFPKISDTLFVRPLEKGMGQAVAERTILRKKENGNWEDWGDVAHRVALGNSLLCPDEGDFEGEYEVLRKHIAQGSLLMSGRHLQHGDETQPQKNFEIFSNCSTAPTSFLSFYLLLNGSGVGRCYDDDFILINWDNAPNVQCVLDENHADFSWTAHTSVRDAKHKYGNNKDTIWYEVEDSREGWAKALELWENAAFEKIHRDKLLILDFSKVRPNGSPINGMQNRPASGPVPLMDAFQKAASLKGSNIAPWKQAMYIDHYFASCVVMGGVRRSARMSTKTWRDKSVLEYIQIKRPIEYAGLNLEETVDFRKCLAGRAAGSFLWSSNNSITVDEEYWKLLALKRKDPGYKSDLAFHARKVHLLLTQCAYGDGTGEPGVINQDKLSQNLDGWEDLNRGDYVGSRKYQVNEDTQIFLSRLAKKAKKKKFVMITNPCGEITIIILGGYCIIGDVVPFHADTLADAEEAFRTATRALIRINLMDSLYSKEVKRTNRIGVGITGIHEFAWKFFRLGFRDLIDEEKSKEFWMTMNRFNHAVRDEAIKYSKKLGLNVPHTKTTIKPAGTTSKLFGLTEGAHLPSLAHYLRWVQFSSSDPLIEEYRNQGYPVRDDLKQYKDTTIVGFPTCPMISTLGMGDKLVQAGDATPEEQYQWLINLEKYWIDGVNEAGEQMCNQDGNQVSYTLKYKPENVDFQHFREMFKKYQSQIKCCSVMPQEDLVAYEYQPEEPITEKQYNALMKKIKDTDIKQDVDFAHIECAGGACPIDFNKPSL